jgi:hypothetical protein
VVREFRAIQALKAIKVILVRTVPKAVLDHRVILVSKAILALRVRPDLTQ